MNIFLSFRTQALLLLILSAVWLASSLVTVVVGQSNTYNPVSWFLVDVLPVALLLLGTAFTIREYRQRSQHRCLFYISIIAAFVPIPLIVLRAYLDAYSAN